MATSMPMAQPAMAYAPQPYGQNYRVPRQYYSIPDPANPFLPSKPPPTASRSHASPRYSRDGTYSIRSYESGNSHPSTPEYPYSPSSSSGSFVHVEETPTTDSGSPNNTWHTKEQPRIRNDSGIGGPQIYPSISTGSSADRDLEKQQLPSPLSDMHHSQSTMRDAEHTTVLYPQSEYEKEPRIEDKAFKLMLNLTLVCPMVSFIFMFWTIFSCLLLTFIQPVRLFVKSHPALRDHLVAWLAPPHHAQLKLIFKTRETTAYSLPMLLMIHLLSPFVSLGVAVAAGVAAFFWIFAAIVGDPGSQDGHNDGRASIVGVKVWWENWLMRALR